MKRFEIINEITKIIYDHDTDEKFVFNPITQRMQLSPKWLGKLNQYNSLK